jgi:hypothetical protein
MIAEGGTIPLPDRVGEDRERPRRWQDSEPRGRVHHA